MFIKSGKLRDIRPGKLTIPRKYRGDTMIEVLVTVLILSVGVLGVAAMQVTTLKNLNSSYSASVAEIIASDFSERLRANPTEALAGNYEHGSKPTNFPDCVANACTLAELADYDKASWWAMLDASLPSATGQVARVAGTNTFIVTVRWDDDRSGSTGINCPVQSAGDLDCYQLNVTI
ncbi:MAG: type IV pilus modification protein PilV [Proteobacteria bacterium]|nr:type IV pilus modification protein PilV [Pseudomonadota bacterium]